MQVADRWHLFENASAAFLAAVRSEMPCLRRALAPTGPVDPATLTRAERVRGMVRNCVKRSIARSSIWPGEASRSRPWRAQPAFRARRSGRSCAASGSMRPQPPEFARRLVADARGRVERGVRIGAELWRRLKASGFAGSLRVVSEWATRRRRDEKLGHAGGAGLSTRTIARSMTTERETGSAQTALINAVIEKAVPALITAREVLDRFHAMMRSKDEAQLDPWIAMAADTKLAAFAAGVRRTRMPSPPQSPRLGPAGRSRGKSTASRPSSVRCSDAPKSICSRQGSWPPHEQSARNIESDPTLRAG